MRFRLRFDDPGFFINDPHLEVKLDGRILYTGRFKGGFEVSVDIEPGRHTLTTAIFRGAGTDVLTHRRAKHQDIPVDLEPAHGYRDVPMVDAKLEYSRLKGNFLQRLSIAVQT